MELLVETALDSYRGKYRVLLDVLQAIDIYAKRIDEKLTIEKKYSYLLSSAKNEKIGILKFSDELSYHSLIKSKLNIRT